MSGSSPGNSAQSQNTSGANGAGGGEGGGGEGQQDIAALIEQHHKALESQQNLFGQSQNELEKLKGQHSETSKILAGIKKAIGGGEEDAPTDPFDEKIAHYTGLIDQYLAAAVEAERKGSPIPLTVKNAIESFQGMIQQLELNKTMTKELAEIKKQVKRVSDPHVAIDQQAFATMDSFIMNGLNTVYGESDEMLNVKDSQFKSVAGLITGEINRLKNEDPQLWDRIRRNPTDQKKLVNHYLQQSIPPRARQLMEDERIKNTPITLQDLQQAWQEVKEIKDPQQRLDIQSKLRHQILEATVMKGRAGVNQLYRGN